MARSLVGTSSPSDAVSADGDDPPPLRPVAPRRIPRQQGLPGGRAVLGGLLMALAALGVFLAYAGAGDGPGDRLVVAAHAIRVGETIERDDLRLEAADLPGAAATTFAVVDDLVGRVALGPIGEDEVVQRSAVTDDRAAGTAHEIALQLPRDQVAVGRLKPGERVDVYVTQDDRTSAVVQGAQVVQIDQGDADALTDARELTVVVRVGSQEAVASLVHALRTGELTIVRSTFATEQAPG